MFLHTLTSVFRNQTPRRATRPRRATLRIESLETRDLMAVLTPVAPTPVTTTYNPPISAPAAGTTDGSLAPYNFSAKAVSGTQIDLAWNSEAQVGSAAYRVDICEYI